MTDLEKLKHLLEHWIEHNEAHAKTYREWTSTAESLGEEEVASLLRQAVEQSGKLNDLFKKAAELL